MHVCELLALDVVSQEVVNIQAGPGNGRRLIETSMRATPVVAADPWGQVRASFHGVLIQPSKCYGVNDADRTRRAIAQSRRTSLAVAADPLGGGLSAEFKLNSPANTLWASCSRR
jgi:hypothetical protein